MSKKRSICGVFAAVILTGCAMSLISTAGFADSLPEEAEHSMDVPAGESISLSLFPAEMPLADTLGLPHEEVLTIEEPETLRTCFVTFSAITCRADADSDAEETCRFVEGTELTITGETADGAWVQVTDGTDTGWTSSAFLSDNADGAVSSSVEVAPTFDYTDEDLYWLAVAIQHEAGCAWLSDEHQLMVGNVILNRVASSRFADTIYGVLTSPGQYSWDTSRAGTPSERAYANAKKLLDGERYLPANVVFQAEFKQGSGTYASIYDATLNNTTYFCYL